MLASMGVGYGVFGLLAQATPPRIERLFVGGESAEANRNRHRKTQGFDATAAKT
jgi:hypothetical protein